MRFAATRAALPPSTARLSDLWKNPASSRITRRHPRQQLPASAAQGRRPLPGGLPAAADPGRRLAAPLRGTLQRRGACRSVAVMACGAGEAQQQSQRVAVIGAGASGIVAARELVAEGHQVKVFESAEEIGGIWAYDADTESDLLGTEQGRRRVHSSMYASLRTNLPREVMSYLDLPFTPEAMGGRSVDSRRFCSHQEVLEYMKEYVHRFNLEETIAFGRSVTRTTPVMAPGADAQGKGASMECTGWDVIHESTSAPAEAPVSERFDAVVVANGHYSQPNLPDPALPGADSFPGFQMHSHNYRTPEQFEGQVVVVVGAQSSGEDISREVAGVAKEVYLCARNWKVPEQATDPTPYGSNNNMWRRHNLAALNADGSVEFEGGLGVPRVDSVIYCTGYRYNFPFLHGSNVVSFDQNRVEPLYEHVFVPAVAPRLAFIGLPFNVVAFHLFHMQSKWVARVLSGRSTLTSEMQEETDEMYRAADASGLPARYVHEMRDKQWDYINRLADYCGDVPHLPAWREQMYKAGSKNKRENPTTYRDVQYDPELQAAAAAQFAELMQEAYGEALAPAGASN